MKRLVMLLAWGTTMSALAYTPTNWLPEHAASDFQQADAIVVARVIGLNRSLTNNTAEFRVTFAVGRTVRGPLKTSDPFTFLIGEDWIGDTPKEDAPRYGLSLYGTQQSYWLQINGVYLICLARTPQGWEPRSGPHSVFRVQKETVQGREPRLLVDSNGNKKEAQDQIVREVRDFPQVLLDDFLAQKLKKGEAQPRNPTDPVGRADAHQWSHDPRSWDGQ